MTKSELAEKLDGLNVEGHGAFVPEDLLKQIVEALS